MRSTPAMLRSTHSLALWAVVALVLAGCAESVARRQSAAPEARACAGISDAQADSFFTDLRDDVDRIEPIREAPTTKPSVTHSLGADIHVRARPGVTAQWLARLAECHAAREAAGAACTTAECPLRLDRVTTSVSSTETGFVVAIRSRDPAVASEIARRAEVVLAPRLPDAVVARP